MTSSIAAAPSSSSWNSAAEPFSPLQNLAALVSLAYLICVYGRLPETFLPVPALAFVLGSLGLAGTLMAGGLGRAGSTRTGIWLLIITVWFVACIPFSAWPGGSLNLFKNVWLKSFALFFMIAGTIVTMRLYMWLTWSLVAAASIILAAGAVFGAGGDRLGLELGSLTNPNDFAAHLLIVMPLLLFFPLYRTGRASSLLSLAVMGGMIALVLKTGSRGGMVTLIAFGAYRFLRGSMKTKAILVAAAFLGVTVAPLLVSTASLQRYAFMFGGDVSKYENTSRELEFAEGSSEARMRLLRASLVATLKNPVFGVGPGQFQSYMAEFTTSQGSKKALWAQTHNSFTQLSSEMGIVPGVLYVLITSWVLRTSRKIAKAALAHGRQDLYAAAEALGSSVVCFVFAAFFGNFAYALYLPLLAGCGESLNLIAHTELSAVKPASRPVTAVNTNVAKGALFVPGAGRREVSRV